MELDQIAPSPLAYLVHDIEDAAVHRRVDLLASEGFAVELGGFHRRARAADLVSPRAVNFGRTWDARLGRRLLVVLRHLVSPKAVRTLCDDAAVIVARNLEMLALACRVRRPHQRLVYECLDIHRLMLGEGGRSRLLRWVERKLLQRTDLVIVSSPAFAREYFGRQQGRSDRVLLVENKVPVASGKPLAPATAGASGAGVGVSPGLAASRPFVIGWFGMLRCRRTLQELLALADQSRGLVEIVIAGVPSPAELPDLPSAVAGRTGVHYLGAYHPQQLADIYDGVDFVWAIDYFEEGLNSAWLLPNRLYEGLAHGAVPIALRAVETGRWLERRQVGLLVDDAAKEIPGLLRAMTVEQHAQLRAAIADLPADALYQTSRERRAIADAIARHRSA